MTECRHIRVTHRQLCAGDLDRLIVLKSRALRAPQTTVDFSELFTTEQTVWAALKTTKGRNTFYITNMGIAVGHVFYIRYFGALTSDWWIEYNGDNYDIVEVEDIDERHEWIAIYANVRGTSTEPVNYA